MARGLRLPSSSLDGPLPTNNSRPVPLNVPSAAVKLPARISSRSPKSKARSCTTNRNVGLAAIFRVTALPPTVRDWSTATPVVLTWKPTVPSWLKLVSPSTSTWPSSVPARPPAEVVTPVAVVAPGENRNRAPWPSLRPGFLPSPPSTGWSLPTLAWAKPIRVTVPVPELSRSRARSAVMVRPATVSANWSAHSRTYGPAGRSSVWVTAAPAASAKVTVSATFTAVLLTWRPRVPLIAKLLPKPTVATAPLISPATPPGVNTHTPVPPDSRNPLSSVVPGSVPGSPRNSDTWVKASVTTRVPAAVRRCSISSTPARRCPRTLRLTGSVGVPAWTRTYGPAGTSTATSVPATATVNCWRAVVVLMATRRLRPLRSTAEDRLASSTAVAVSEPATPCGRMRSAPSATVSVTRVFEPVPRARETPSRPRSRVVPSALLTKVNDPDSV